MKMLKRVISFGFPNSRFIVLLWVFIFNIKSFESKIKGEPIEFNYHQFHPEKIMECRPTENAKNDAANMAFSTKTPVGRFLMHEAPSTLKEARTFCGIKDMKLFNPDSWESIIEFVDKVKQCAEFMTPNFEIWTDLHVELKDLLEDKTKRWLYQAVFFPDLQRQGKRIPFWENLIYGHLTLQFSYDNDAIISRFVSHDKKLPYICVKELKSTTEDPPSSTMFVKTTSDSANSMTPVEMLTDTTIPTASASTSSIMPIDTDIPTPYATTHLELETGTNTPATRKMTSSDMFTDAATSSPSTNSVADMFTDTTIPTASKTSTSDMFSDTPNSSASGTTVVNFSTDIPTAATSVNMSTHTSTTTSSVTTAVDMSTCTPAATATIHDLSTDTTTPSATATIHVDLSTDTTNSTVTTTTPGDNSTDKTTPFASTTTSNESDSDGYCEGRTYFHDNFTIVFKDIDFGSNATAYPCPKGSYGYATWKCSKEEKNFTGNPEVFCEEIDCSKELRELGPPIEANRRGKIPEMRTQGDSPAKDKIELGPPKKGARRSKNHGMRTQGDPSAKDKKDMNKFGDAYVKSYLAERMRKCGDVGKDEVFEKMKKNRQKLKEKPLREMRQGMDNVLDMYNRLVDKDSLMWRNMSEEDSRKTSMEFIKETEATAWVLGCEDDEILAMRKDNLAIEIFDLCQNEERQELSLSLTSQGIGKVHLPGNLNVTQDTFCNKPVHRGILAGYKNIESYLNPNSSMKIISGIIGVSLGDFNESYSMPEEESVRIILKHPPTSSEASRVCVFLNWNYEESDSIYGVWDNKGCKVIRSEEEFTECECNHLTNFAILMDFAGPEFKEKDDLVLKLLSLICCGISSVTLLLTVIIYLTVRSLRSRRNTITCNLAACLLAMNILIQTGLNRVEKTICQIVSAVLQYSVLSAFFWMLLEGILLYRMVITVFQKKNVPSFVLYIIAYGIPCAIVVLCSAMYPAEMIREKYCWPAKEKGLIWSVLGPVLLIIVVNLIIFGLTLNAASRIDKMNSANTSFSNKKKTLVQRSKGMMSLTCLLGFTWAIGFFYVPMKEVAAYIFVILNGLQGFFLFLTQMIFNDPVRSKLFAIYKENFTRFSSKTSSLHANIARNTKSNPKEANVKKITPSKSDLSINCPPSEEDLSSAPPPPYEELQVRLTVFEGIQQIQGLNHPFEVIQQEI
ncbi:unnamed protein product [Larinioides sclopetarius]|uniref:Uncharacterized protein n=1 Tax=Larinioides sclopetarius TaxID=280406 RepID=A0AAV1YT91_9ARAC